MFPFPKTSLSVSVLGLTAALALLPADVRAEPLQLEYDVYYKGLRALSARFDMVLGPHDYRISVDAETSGLLSIFVSWRNRSISTGEITAQGISPRYHRQTGSWRGKSRSVTLAFDPQAPVEVEVDPPAAADKREPVAPELTVHSVDMLSAIVGVQHAVASGSGCAGTWPVFDGRRRYDVTVEERGVVELEPSAYAAYEGPALHCRATYQAVAGASKQTDSPSRKLSALDLWLAPVGIGGKPVLVRMQGEGDFGVAYVHLRSLQRSEAVAEGYGRGLPGS